MNKSIIICPGCTWIGLKKDLSEYGTCPICGYTNNVEPYRLLTISEILKAEGEFNNVLLGPFCRKLLQIISEEQK